MAAEEEFGAGVDEFFQTALATARDPFDRSVVGPCQRMVCDEDAQRAGLRFLKFCGGDSGLAARDLALRPVEAELPRARSVDGDDGEKRCVPRLGLNAV